MGSIQIKSYFGDWKTVEREHAKRYVNRLIGGGCIKKKIEGNHLRGISLKDLLDCTDEHEPPKIAIPIVCSHMQHEPIEEQINPNLVEMCDCVVEIEELARREAFYRFQQEIMFSLTVWHNDEKIRNALPPPTKWIGECADVLNEICACAK